MGFVYNGWNLLSEYDLVGGLAAVRSYTWGLDLSGSEQGTGGVGGLLLGRFHEDGIATTVVYTFDRNGNVAKGVTASAGSVEIAYEYGPFGELVRSTGALASANPFRFSTKYQDGETGLLYYGYRYYQPQTGLWTSRDPIEEEGGTNILGFLSNNPVNDVDLLGLSACDKFRKELDRLAKQIAAKQLKVRTILNDQVKDRMEDLVLDRGKQKHKGHIPGAPPSETRRGHWKILNEQKANLDRRRAELIDLTQRFAEVQCQYSACKAAEKKALQKGGKAIGKKCIGFVCRKTPIAIILFACDAAEGGACHAINEFTWPVSELWTE